MNTVASVSMTEPAFDEGTGLICGDFGHDNPIFKQILRNLPAYICLTEQQQSASKAIVELMIRESKQTATSSSLLLDRLSDCLLYALLRDNIDAHKGLFAAMAHPQIGKAIEPVIKPLGFDWKLGIGLISGVGAKELVVSTLGVLYTNEGDVENVNLSDRIPITPLVALAYMLFVLIYFPCIATFAAIKQESGSWKWAIFAAGYTTGLAWLVAFTVFQIGSIII